MSDLKSQVYDLIRQFSGQANTLTIPRPFITMTGSLEAALLLSQIIYWSDRSSMDDGWFAKSYPEWEAELTLTQYQIAKAIKVLKAFGVETKLKKFNGAPVVHYRINQSVFLKWIMKFFDNQIIKEFDNPLTEPTHSRKDLPSDDGAQKSTPQPKPKKAREPNPIFDAVALGSFHIKNVNGDKSLGGRIGKIVAWLKTQDNVTPERIAEFYEWYADETDEASAPRDLDKFSTWWRQFDEDDGGGSGWNGYDSEAAFNKIFDPKYIVTKDG